MKQLPQWPYLSIWYMALTSIQSVAVTVFSCWTCQNAQNAFWVTCLSAYIIFVTSSLPSPYRELCSLGFMLPLLCDLLYIHMICTVSGSNPMFFPCCTVSIPVIAQGFAELTLLLFSLLTSPYRKLTFHGVLCLAPRFPVSIFSFGLLFLPHIARPTTEWPCPIVASLNSYYFSNTFSSFPLE